jgi:hypothetical protein
MQLEGSCHCDSVRFAVQSVHPYPYQRCYCSVCRKTQGGGGYSINLSADARSMRLKGASHITVYHALLPSPEGGERRTSSAERHFCSLCGSALWLFSPEWPELIHPFASAIDTELPPPPELTHIFVGSRAPWVEISPRPRGRVFEAYPEESIEQWHKRLGLETN